MSRIGKKPVIVPAGVTASIGDGKLSMKGPKGSRHAPKLVVLLAKRIPSNSRPPA